MKRINIEQQNFHSLAIKKLFLALTDWKCPAVVRRDLLVCTPTFPVFPPSPPPFYHHRQHVQKTQQAGRKAAH